MADMKRAIIIAAGEGKRLRPVTLEIPKPLIKVNGKRMIDTGIEALRANGIREIYIVVGYKKELFYEIYGNVPDIHLIENPDYLNGNNITSMYYARQYLPEAFVLEADIMISNPGIFNREIERSGYMAMWMEPVQEWLIKVKGKRILGYEKDGGGTGYQLMGISMWNAEDGARLAEDIRHAVEVDKNREIYWDEVALGLVRNRYYLEVKEIKRNDICEIDTFEELTMMDASYRNYEYQRGLTGGKE